MREPTILYIEDSPFYQKMFKSIFDQEDKLFFAANLLDGMITALLNKVDIVFLDVMLPEGRGVDIIKELKEYLPNVFIVMVTSDNTAQTVHESVGLGAKGYIVKPFSVDNINKYLNIWEKDFASLPTTIHSNKIQVCLDNLYNKKKLVQEKLEKTKIQLWMERKIKNIYPIIYFEFIDVPINGKNNERYISRLIFATALDFIGNFHALGVWHEITIRNEKPLYLLKRTLENLKSRGLEDALLIIMDNDIGNKQEFANFFPLANISHKFITYSDIMLTDIATYSVLKKLISLVSYFDFQKTIQAIATLEDNLKKFNNEFYLKLNNNLREIENLFKFPDDVRRVIFGDIRPLELKIRFNQLIKKKECFESVEIMENLLVNFFSKESLDDIKNEKFILYSESDFKQAMFAMYNLYPSRFPQNERLID